ncbi:MAG: 3-hydroxyacyl-ACP dehydratase FabZ family protein [Rhodoferax sp.]
MPIDPMARTLVVPPDHPAFAGHFPGTPILPGVVLLDTVVRLAPGAAAGVAEIAAAKFFSPVTPGESLVITYTHAAGAGLRFNIVCAARRVASGTLVLAA